MIHDLTNIHGSNVAREGLRLFDAGLANGDTIRFPVYYQVIYREGITRPDFYCALMVVQSYVSCKDYKG